jgi:hypothetical protein
MTAEGLDALLAKATVEPAVPELRVRSIHTEALGIEHHVIPGTGHLTVEDGYGP